MLLHGLTSAHAMHLLCTYSIVDGDHLLQLVSEDAESLPIDSETNAQKGDWDWDGQVRMGAMFIQGVMR